MLVLQSFGPANGEISASPFCIKAMCLLQMSGLPWRIDLTAPLDQAPRKKFPVLDDEGSLVPDSTDIARHLEGQHGIDFYPGLSEMQKAESHAISRMVEEHLAWVSAYHRWGVDENWSAFWPEFFDFLPEARRSEVAQSIRAELLRGLMMNGIARMPANEVYARGLEDLDALSTLLGAKPFLFGVRPTYADASVAPFLALLSCHPVDTVMKRAVRESEILSDYLARVRAALFPTADILKAD